MGPKRRSLRAPRRNSPRGSSIPSVLLRDADDADPLEDALAASDHDDENNFPYEQHHSDVDPVTDDAAQPDSLVTTFIDQVHAIATGVTDKTATEYLRLVENFKTWVPNEGPLQALDTPDLFSEDLPHYIPEVIIAWIVAKCDDLTLESSPRPSAELRSTYSTAMKMRAALTYGYAQSSARGRIPWHLSDSGKWVGNPSCSERVTRYMQSLKRRKTRNGDAAVSAKAVTPEILEKLYNYNQASADHPTSSTWGGTNARKLLHAASVVAFWCLLRADEITRIDMRHIRTIDEDSCELILEYRKTHQLGNIKPFRLHRMDVSIAYMCPIRALQEWISVRKSAPGFLFPRLRRKGDVGSCDLALTSAKLLEYFRHNLVDIGINPQPYGTHSFRRGGCQWLSYGCRWSLQRICDWGGWSLECTNLTITRYLIGDNDDSLDDRSQWLNPNRATTVICGACNRDCQCGR